MFQQIKIYLGKFLYSEKWAALTQPPRTTPIVAVTGHKSLEEIARDTVAANQQQLARQTPDGTCGGAPFTQVSAAFGQLGGGQQEV